MFQKGVSPVSKYSNYSSDESGDYEHIHFTKNNVANSSCGFATIDWC
jgi:hypothetical protein